MEAATTGPGTGTDDELARKRAEQADQNGGAPEGDFPGEGDQARGGDAPEGESGDGEETPPAIPPLTLEGEGQLSLKVGGAKPNVSTVKMRGGSIAIEGDDAGQFEIGQLVDLGIKGRVSEIQFVQKRNVQTGEVDVTERRHIMKIEAIERV